ncbi:hypothetical protein FOA43_002381 [Brettanomyces nanus]|uniref:CBM21 domain-containing protein n=1 Tax=Eeniella nana TaxID=13502 RepID=A0A875RZS9_EENNA|nr:uncharacterized protein FOA43_002381 [Brettanomyces nanus]QPG75041.1 hypothetical protein FOA43_002381 [Brettanomyces nanus]
MPFVHSSRKKRAGFGKGLTVDGLGSIDGISGANATAGASAHSGRSAGAGTGSTKGTLEIAESPFSDNPGESRGFRGSVDSEEDIPLSLSFMRRPSRSDSMDLDKSIERIMKQNTLYNSRLAKFENRQSKGPSVVHGESPISPVSPVSPVSPISPTSSPGSSTAEALDEAAYPHLHSLIRRKSGELVKSSLKLQSLGSSRSLPATPTFKQVHFGVNIDVKFFKEKDKPTSISAGNSPCTSDDEGDSSDSGRSSGSSGSGNSDYDSDIDSGSSRRSNDYYANFHTLFMSSRDYVEKSSLRNLNRFRKLISGWDLDLSLFPKVYYSDEIDREVPVFLESLHLNSDKTCILGQVAVKNISYSKKVTARYTFDDWTTVINIDATFTPNMPRILKRACYDRFVFQISVPLMLSQFLGSHKYSSDLIPTFSCCLRYISGGQEYWDNNFNHNYQIRFVPYHKRTHGHGKSAAVPPPRVAPLDVPLRRTLSADNLKKSRKFETLKGTSSPRMLGVRASPRPTQIVSPSPEFAGNFAYTTGGSSSIDSPGTPAVLRDLRETATGIRGNFNSLSPRSMVSLEKEDPFTSFSLDNMKVGREVKPSPNVTTNSEDMVSSADHQQSGNSERDAKLSRRAASNKENSSSSSPTNEPSKPDIDSDSYKAMLKKYCFFKSPSTVSSFLEHDQDENGFY